MALKSITGADFGRNRSRAFKDVAIGFTRNPFTLDVNAVSNEEAIKQSVKNLILTVPGEKFFNPNYGSRISQLLFEPLDPFTIDSIKNEILNTLSNYEKRVQVSQVICQPDYENNAIDVNLQYKIVGMPIVESIDFVLQRP
ncbi:baseplate wedge subunit [Synechococcus phage S-MS29]|jgi:phage baseplate assembly protein W|nr:baseplate wedge subunit [Synechococcus phage S-MS29]